MKTPREILLARHHAATPDLNAIRKTVVTGLSNQAAGTQSRRTSGLAYFREWCRDVIWPSRRVWAGLTVVWVVILGGHFSLREPSQPFVAKSSRQSQQIIMALKDQQTILTELLGDHSIPRDADRQRLFLPKPRTEHVKSLTV